MLEEIRYVEKMLNSNTTEIALDFTRNVLSVPIIPSKLDYSNDGFCYKMLFLCFKGATVRNYSHWTCFVFLWNTVLEILGQMITSTWPAQNTAQQWLHQQVILQMDQNYDQHVSWSLASASSHNFHCTQICLDSTAWASQVSGNSVIPSGSQHSRTPKTIHRFNENFNRATNTERYTALNSDI